MSRKPLLLGLAAAFLLIWAGTGTADAQSACADLGGTVDPDQTCHVHGATSTYTLDVSFPVSYPDQQPLTNFVTQQRDQWAGEAQMYPPLNQPPYPLGMTGTAYRSGAPASGTQSLVLTMNQDLGAHPVVTFKAFTYDLSTGAPITFDTLFKPGTKPLAVLFAIVQREVAKRAPVALASVLDPGVDGYQNFAITDDAVLFFFDQGRILPMVDGPQQVSVPRTELASLLA
jgi:hypothetical protein